MPNTCSHITLLQLMGFPESEYGVFNPNGRGAWLLSNIIYWQSLRFSILFTTDRDFNLNLAMLCYQKRRLAHTTLRNVRPLEYANILGFDGLACMSVACRYGKFKSFS
jgi:hypothetical protein